MFIRQSASLAHWCKSWSPYAPSRLSDRPAPIPWLRLRDVLLGGAGKHTASLHWGDDAHLASCGRSPGSPNFAV
eukprot:scaffold290899_cov42-Prasinocladus_malaysianus.AAC.1